MSNKKFHVLGERNVVLAEVDTFDEAQKWVAGYTRDGDSGGYSFITIEHCGEHENEVLRTYDFEKGDDDA